MIGSCSLETVDIEDPVACQPACYHFFVTWLARYDAPIYTNTKFRLQNYYWIWCCFLKKEWMTPETKYWCCSEILVGAVWQVCCCFLSWIITFYSKRLKRAFISSMVNQQHVECWISQKNFAFGLIFYQREDLLSTYFRAWITQEPKIVFRNLF